MSGRVELGVGLMRYTPIVIALAFAVLIGPAAGAQRSTDDELYAVPRFDATRNPRQDIRAAAATARGRHILVELGGQWCTWCLTLDRYLESQTEVEAAFSRSFVVVRVNVSTQNPNSAFLSAFPTPEHYPHFIVLNAEGAYLGSQATEPFREGAGYSAEGLITFAQEWAPSR